MKIEPLGIAVCRMEGTMREPTQPVFESLKLLLMPSSGERHASVLPTQHIQPFTAIPLSIKLKLLV